MGQVRLNELEVKVYQIAISLAVEFRSKNLSPTFLEKALSLFPESGKIVAWIKLENLPSIRSFLRAGFQKIKEEEIHCYPSIRMERIC